MEYNQKNRHVPSVPRAQNHHRFSEPEMPCHAGPGISVSHHRPARSPSGYTLDSHQDLSALLNTPPHDLWCDAISCPGSWQRPWTRMTFSNIPGQAVANREHPAEHLPQPWRNTSANDFGPGKRIYCRQKSRSLSEKVSRVLKWFPWWYQWLLREPPIPSCRVCPLAVWCHRREILLHLQHTYNRPKGPK